MKYKNTMLKILKLFVFFLAIFFSFEVLSQSNRGYKITLLNNSWTDSVVYLGYYHGKFQYAKDTAFFDKKGKAVFENENESLDPGIYFIVLPNKRHFDIVIHKDQHFTIQIDTADLVNKTTFRGSDENSYFYENNRKVNQLANQLTENNKVIEQLKSKNLNADSILELNQKINEDIVALRDDFIKNHPNSLVAKVFLMTKDLKIPEYKTNPDGSIDTINAYWYFKNNYWNNFDFKYDALVRTPTFHTKLERYFSNVIIQHPDTIKKEIDAIIAKTDPKSELFRYMVWFLTYFYESSQIMGFDAIFVHMVDKYYKTNMVFWMTEERKNKIIERADKIRNILIGSTAPNMSLMAVDQQNFIPLHSVDANFTILVFWDPNCGHCKTEIERLRQFYSESKTEFGIQIYSVCIESNLEKWLASIKEKNIENWINVNATQSALGHYQELYDVFTTPTIFLLDKNKKIIAKRISAETLSSFLPTYVSSFQNSYQYENLLKTSY